MRVQSLCPLALLVFWVSLFSATFCYANDKTVEVVGLGECADCKESNVKASHAVSGKILLWVVSDVTMFVFFFYFGHALYSMIQGRGTGNFTKALQFVYLELFFRQCIAA